MIHIQLSMLLISIFLGAAMGLTYDLVRIFRRIISHNNILIFFQDIIYWIVWAFVVIDKIHVFNSGEVRFYIFLGIGIGILVYVYTIGWVLWKIVSHILCLIKKSRKKSKKMLKNGEKRSKIKVTIL